ncbi:MAG: N-acetyltransferase [Bryobacterales bacterium]|nr:N-acetyltransferase [Bryobacteraceae bacterium]MDW8355452.1 N-acetyltransferase [Bryobacterales bacterium]
MSPDHTRGIAIRRARMQDVPEVLRLINDYAAQGLMLPRTESELAENIRDFLVACWDGRVVGCGALHFYGPLSAEIRSLAVRPEFKGSGVGRRLVQALEEEAREHGLRAVFAFTYVPGFFSKLGFEEVERDRLPAKVWKDCLRCPKFYCCDEIAMQKVLAPEGFAAAAPPEPMEEDIVLPIVRSAPRSAN